MHCYLTLPGLSHRLAHGHDDAPTWAALVDRVGGRWEGDRVLVALDVPAEQAVGQALDWVGTEVDGLGIAAAVAETPATDGIPTGTLGARLRIAARYARPGELFVLPPCPLPEGVGRFELPRALAQAIGGEAFRAFDARG